MGYSLCQPLAFLAKNKALNPLAFFIYHKVNRLQVYDFGEMIMMYGYLFYLLFYLLVWIKKIIKQEKKANITYNKNKQPSKEEDQLHVNQK